MSNVVTLPVITRLDLDPGRVLQAAIEDNLTEVVIVGFDQDGKEYFASSKSDAADVIFHLERAKHRLMRVIDQD